MLLFGILFTYQVIFRNHKKAATNVNRCAPFESYFEFRTKSCRQEGGKAAMAGFRMLFGECCHSERYEKLYLEVWNTRV